MVDIDGHGPEPPPDADEAETLVGFLEYQRATLLWKGQGVDSEGLRLRVAASSMTLGGILKHMAFVEDHWLGLNSAVSSTERRMGRPGTQWTGRRILTGSGTRPPMTLPSNCSPCGRDRWTARGA